MRNINDLIQLVLHEDSFDSFDTNEIVAVLEYCSDQYNNVGDSPIPDERFDSLERYLKISDPTNKYFIGVGSKVRGEKVELPFEMGGLDQIEIGEIEKWVKQNDLQEELMVISDKMDGTSCLLIYDDNGNIQIAYSRGDGIHAHDITRHISKITNVPKQVSGKMVIRGEVELSETNFSKIKPHIKNRAGKEYKNSRNCVAGLMNSESNSQMVYDHLSFIAYQIVNSNDSKMDQLHILEDEGFHVVQIVTTLGKDLTDHSLSEHIKERKKALDYAIDGIVIDVNSAEKRSEMNPTRDTLNPKYAIKYKVTDENNIALTTVIGVEWNISKHGFAKPRVNVESTELDGVTIQYCTGFNAKFINDNIIGPGAVIKITRSGQVIPYILEVVTPAKHPQLPKGEYEWNENGVELVLKDHSKNEKVAVEQVIHFFSTVDAPFLKEGNIQTMFNNHDYHDSIHAIKSMMNYAQDHWYSCLGVIGSKTYDGLRDTFSGIEFFKLLGAVPFFGIGLGAKKFKKLTKSLRISSLGDFLNITFEQIVSVESFEEKTALKILSGKEEFAEFFKSLPDYVSVSFVEESSSSSMLDEKVVFTGFRDSNLEKMIEDAGGEMKSSVSKNTTLVVAADPNNNSGKTKKAKELGIKVIGVDELKKMLGDVTIVIKPKKETKKKEEIKDDIIQF